MGVKQAGSLTLDDRPLVDDADPLILSITSLWIHHHEYAIPIIFISDDHW